MARTLSIIRRKPNLVDLTTPRRSGVIGFRFSFATNFDAPFTPFQVVRNQGMKVLRPPVSGGPRTPDVSSGKQRKNFVGFIFDPTEYGITDTAPFFIRVEPETSPGVFGAAEAIHLILPYSSTPDRPIVLSGTVPAGATLANSLEIQLPYQCNNWEIDNIGINYLCFASNPLGDEFSIPTGAIFEQTYSPVSQIFIRGVGGATTLTSVFTLQSSKSIAVSEVEEEVPTPAIISAIVMNAPALLDLTIIGSNFDSAILTDTYITLDGAGIGHLVLTYNDIIAVPPGAVWPTLIIIDSTLLFGLADGDTITVTSNGLTSDPATIYTVPWIMLTAVP